MQTNVHETQTERFNPVSYWRSQRRRIIVLLAIWGIAGLAVSIVFVRFFNQFSIGNIPFGFWMAQQGSIFIFVLLIFAYAYLSDRADRKAGVHETPETTAKSRIDH